MSDTEIVIRRGNRNVDELGKVTWTEDSRKVGVVTSRAPDEPHNVECHNVMDMLLNQINMEKS